MKSYTAVKANKQDPHVNLDTSPNHRLYEKKKYQENI